MAKRLIPRVLPDGQTEIKFLKIKPDANRIEYEICDNITDAIKFASDAVPPDIARGIFQMLLHHGGEPGCKVEICEYSENKTTPIITYDFMKVVADDYIPF